VSIQACRIRLFSNVHLLLRYKHFGHRPCVR
jgi:hypothetical protein